MKLTISVSEVNALFPLLDFTETVEVPVVLTISKSSKEDDTLELAVEKGKIASVSKDKAKESISATHSNKNENRSECKTKTGINKDNGNSDDDSESDEVESLVKQMTNHFVDHDSSWEEDQEFSQNNW